ncbi:hypothetical protein [Streptomyces chryseus]|uniref:hypothetical protein n=1 Tax=Streptomyces chryseus TaxID=68186 RepID=UPI00110F74AF|nr:hypothetical protein [Streptomyces chryseus]
MGALDPLAVLDVVITVVSTVPVWGPVLAVLVGVAVWWRLRPTGRHRGGQPSLRTTVRTSVREVVRHLADTGPEPAGADPLTYADTGPDVSFESCPAVSGHDEEGER